MGIDYYSITISSFIVWKFYDNVGILLKVFTEMSMWVQSSFSRKISCSNFVAIALFGVRVLNVPGATSPFSSILDPGTLTETLLSS